MPPRQERLAGRILVGLTERFTLAPGSTKRIAGVRLYRKMWRAVLGEDTKLRLCQSQTSLPMREHGIVWLFCKHANDEMNRCPK